MGQDSAAVIAAGPAKAVLVKGKDASHYVLTDPDLINNAALKDPDEGRGSARPDRLAAAQRRSGPVRPHLARRRRANYDLAKLLVEPPFLALTLTILVAAALAFLHGLARFGPARAEARAIPFGKQALVDTTAMLLRRAGRLDELGGRYAALMRGGAGALLGAPQGLQGRGARPMARFPRQGRAARLYRAGATPPHVTKQPQNARRQRGGCTTGSQGGCVNVDDVKAMATRIRAEIGKAITGQARHGRPDADRAVRRRPHPAGRPARERPRP